MIPESEERVKQEIRDILDGLECILTAHDSCAELVEYRNKRAVISCGGPCLKCDNRCIEGAIKDRLPDVEVIVQ